MARELDLDKAVRVLARAVVAIAERDMFTLGDDVYLLANAPAEEPLREGERVVVVDEPTRPGGGTSISDERWSRRHGIFTRKGVSGEGVPVKLDSDQEVIIWPHNLRREREDERPAEKKPDPAGSEK